jgi:cardiolipin synthase
MSDAPVERALEAIEHALNRSAGSRPVPGNRVRLVQDAEAYRVMLEMIDGARSWIHFENYIIRGDAVGIEFAERLIARARDGVHVRVLYDWLGSIATRRRYWRRLRDVGVEVRAFNPPRLLDVFANVTRNHRKVLVADGAAAITGGHCIGREWTGEDDEHGQPWRDTAVAVYGPAAAMLDQAFARTWELAGGVLPADHVVAQVRQAGSAEVRVIAGEPGRERTYRVVELLSAGTIDRIWITDAYFIAPPRLLQALRDAAMDGVDVRLLVPGSSDIPFVRNLTRIGYRDLLRAGVRIWEWNGPMLHAKSVVADMRWVRIGSSNLNPSSLFGNYELDVLVDDPAFAESVEQQFRRDIMRSREVVRRPLRGPPRISRVLPTALERHRPEHPEAVHRPVRGETRRRAALAVRTLAGNARRSIFGPTAIALMVLGGFFVVLPRITAYVFAVLCVWLAGAAGREAFRRRADR